MAAMHRVSLSSIWLATTWPVRPRSAMSGGTAKGSMIRPLLWAASHTISAQRRRHRDAHHRRGQAQQHAQPFFPDAQIELSHLGRELRRNVMALLGQISGEFLVDLGRCPSHGRAECHGINTGRAEKF